MTDVDPSYYEDGEGLDAFSLVFTCAAPSSCKVLSHHHEANIDLLLRLSSGMVLVGSLPIGPLSLSGSGVPQGPTTFLHSSSPLSALSTLHCYGWNLAILSMFSSLDGEP